MAMANSILSFPNRGPGAIPAIAAIVRAMCTGQFSSGCARAYSPILWLAAARPWRLRARCASRRTASICIQASIS